MSKLEKQKNHDESGPLFKDIVDSALFQSCVDTWQEKRVPSELCAVDDDSKKEGHKVLRELGYSVPSLRKGIWGCCGYFTEGGLIQKVHESAERFNDASEALVPQGAVDLVQEVKDLFGAATLAGYPDDTPEAGESLEE